MDWAAFYWGIAILAGALIALLTVWNIEARVKVVPSLREADSLVVRGDWVFDAPAAVVGSVTLPEVGETRHYR